MRHLILVVLSALCFAVPARARGKALPPETIDALLDRMPPAEAVRTRYNEFDDLSLLRRELPGLKAQGDFVPAVVGMLDGLEPGTVESEAKLYRLLLLLQVDSDARARAAVERVKALRPAIMAQDGGQKPAFRFNRVAGVVLFQMGREDESQPWVAALKGRSRQERLNALADARWLNLSPSAELRADRAYPLLNRECPDDPCNLELILPRMDRMGANAQMVAVQALRDMEWRGLRDPRIRPAVAAVSEKHPESSGLGEVARTSLKMIDGLEAPK